MFLKPNTPPPPPKSSSSNSNLNLKQQKFNRKTTLAPPLPSRIDLLQDKSYPPHFFIFLLPYNSSTHIMYAREEP